MTEKDICDLLQLVNSGIINLDDARKERNMKRAEILKNHPYKIWQGSDGLWYTYLPDASKKKGVAKRKRRTEEELQDCIIEYYGGKVPEKKKEDLAPIYNKFAFKYMFKDLLSYKKEVVGITDNTAYVYESDYRRFFKGTDIEYKDVRYMEEDDVKRYIVSRIKALGLKKRNTKDMINYMRATFERAKRELTVNPFQYIKPEMFNKHFAESKPKTAEQRTVSAPQMAQLNQRFAYYHEKKPKYIPIYAVELASLTGMRVGEIAALRWDHIKDDYILIDQSEKYNRVEKTYYIGSTKNGKVREFPMTAEIRKLLKTVYDIEEKYGYLTDYVFSDEKGQCHSRTISNCARNACIYMGMDVKPIHAYRRTVSSMMKSNGVPTVVVASLMGHTPEVNESNYTYDLSSNDYKYQQVADITAKIKVG